MDRSVSFSVASYKTKSNIETVRVQSLHWRHRTDALPKPSPASAYLHTPRWAVYQTDGPACPNPHCMPVDIIPIPPRS